MTVGTALAVLSAIGPAIRSLKIPNLIEADFRAVDALLEVADKRQSAGDEESAEAIEAEADQLARRLIRDRIRFRESTGEIEFRDQGLFDSRRLPTSYLDDIVRALADVPGWVVNTEVHAGGVVWDVVVHARGPNGRLRVGLEVRSGTAFAPAPVLARLLGALAGSQGAIGGAALVVNTDDESFELGLIRSALASLSAQGADLPVALASNIRILGWRSGDDPAALQAFVRGIIEGKA